MIRSHYVRNKGKEVTEFGTRRSPGNMKKGDGLYKKWIEEGKKFGIEFFERDWWDSRGE